MIRDSPTQIILPFQPMISGVTLGVIVGVTGGIELGAGVLELLDKAIKLICHVVMLAYEQRKVINSFVTGYKNAAYDDTVTQFRYNPTRLAVAS